MTPSIELREALELLSLFAEHIESCDEEDLLALDVDKHRPSVLSALAAQSRELLARVTKA